MARPCPVNQLHRRVWNCHISGRKQDISIQYDYIIIIIIGDFNNNILLKNALIATMLSLHLNPVNMSLPPHFHSTSSGLIDLVFVNKVTKVLLYDQISLLFFQS